MIGRELMMTQEPQQERNGSLLAIGYQAPENLELEEIVISEDNDEERVKEAFKCNDCEYLSQTYSDITEHIKNHKERYCCTECDLVFPNNAELEKHKEKQHAKKLLACDNCNYTTRTSLELSLHKSRCLVEPPSKDELEVHQKDKHDDVKDVNFVIS